MTKKKYVTIFPECEYVHLKKDVGMLPYSLGKYCGYEYSLVCYENESFTKQDIEKFHLKCIKKEKNDILDFAIYILKNGKQIDILNLYHISSRRNVLWIFLYKLVNPRGKVHMKLYADYRMLALVNMYPKSLRGKIKTSILRKQVDLYTVESKRMQTVLTNKWNINIKIIPNGIYSDKSMIPTKISEKKNVFLTVGRLGTEQKATENLLQAFECIKDKMDWELWLVGSIEENFNKYIENYYIQNPDLKNRVFFKGNISDAQRLNKIYKQAKIFVLPSKWEGFPITLIEALEQGEYLIVSDQVPATDDIGKNGEYAEVVQYGNIYNLAETMLKAVNCECTEKILEERYKWIRDNFTWQPIVEKLDQYLKQL